MGPPDTYCSSGTLDSLATPAIFEVMAIMVGIISPFILSFVLLHSDEICRQPADRTVLTPAASVDTPVQQGHHHHLSHPQRLDRQSSDVTVKRQAPPTRRLQ